MSPLRRACARLIGTFAGGRRERELADEIESHIAMLADDYMRSGMSPEQARRTAFDKLGGVEPVKETVRDQRGLPWLETLIQDLGYALRGLRRNPGFALTAIATLALGIGANTAIFSALYATVLRPLPFPEADRLVKIDHENPSGGFVEGAAWEQYDEWRADVAAFDALAAYQMQRHEMVGYGEPRQLMTLKVSDTFFPLLGTGPLLGRTVSQDDFASERRVLVISHRLWQTAFEGDPAILGREVRLSGEPYAIVGVMPRRFRYPPVVLQVPGLSIEAWEPLPQKRENQPAIIARLARDKTIEDAKAELDVLIHRRDRRAIPAAKRWGARLTLISDQVSGHLRPAAQTLFAAVGLVLLIACANVASLLLARNSARTREIAVRTAIGAGRGRLVRQVLTESFVLSTLGASVGVLWAHWAMRSLAPLFPHGIPRVEEIGLSGAALAFTAAAAVVSTAVFGLAPAFEASRVGVFESLKGSAASASASPRSNRILRALVTGEVALSIVLLVGASLLLRSLYALVSVDTGFRASSVLTVRLSLDPQKYPDWRRLRAFHGAVLDNLKAIPGVETSALTEVLPLSGRSILSPVVLNGLPDRDRKAFAEYVIVTPGYFRAMGVSLLAGRLLSEQDTANAGRVAIISRSAAEQLWPGEDPLGKAIRNSSGYTDEAARVVVGVVGDEKHWNVWTAPDPKVYIPYEQAETPGAQRSLRILAFAVLRTSVEPEGLSSAVRQAVWAVDPDQPIHELKPMQRLVDDSMAVQRFQSVLLAAMAALALAMASVGVYGVLAFLVSRRRFEIGVRLALGATSGEVLRTTLAYGLKPVLLGLVLGLPAAALLSRVVEHELFGVERFDALSYGLVTLALLAAALLACLPAARRAARVDPLAALRHE